MGTPDFAVPSLKILQENGYEIAAVITAPDRPAGRGRKLRPSPVKQYALDHDLQVLQPVKLRDPDFLEELRSLQPDLAVVVAFRMLPRLVWEIPRLGTFNLHASLLPDYRGAAPINWVIINGETQTGMTTFLIDEKIDTGNLLLQHVQEIPAEWTAGDLHDVMMEQGAGLVLQTVQAFDAGKIEPREQDHSAFRNKAPKIHKEDCRINWAQPAKRVHNLIRGLSPYPAAWTTLDGKNLKIFRTRLNSRAAITPGQVHVVEEDNAILVDCADYCLEILELQLEGKKRMSSADFLRGYKGEWSNLI